MSFNVVLNHCYGGFSLSRKALNLYNSYRIENGLEPTNFVYGIERDDPLLVKTVQTLGSRKASGRLASLAIHSIPLEYQNYYSIEDIDGAESLILKTDALLFDRLCHLNIQYLNLSQCRYILQDLKRIICDIDTHILEDGGQCDDEDEEEDEYGDEEYALDSDF